MIKVSGTNVGTETNHMAKPTFKYPSRTAADVQRRAKQSSGRYDSYVTEEVTWFKPKPGENCIRLIPWLSGADPDFNKLEERWGNHWGIDIIVHRNVGPDNGTYLCLDKMTGAPCPICDAWRGDDIDELKPSDRVLCWLLDRNDEKAGPQLWAMPLGVSKDISAVSQVKGSGADRGEVLLIDNPDEGYDVFFDREGEKIRTQYKRVAVARDPTPLAEKQKEQDGLLAYVLERRLPDILKYYEPDYLDKILSGQQRADGSDEPVRGDDNVRPLRSRRRDDAGASGDREDTGRGRGDDRENPPWQDDRSARGGEGKPGSRRRHAEDDAAARDAGAEAENEAREARDYSHRGRAAAAEADIGPRERRRPREPENREPDRPAERTADAARGRLRNVGRRDR
jgi:hypothetical protein